MLFTATVLSFGLCFLLTPRARTWAWRLQLVDRPDGRRKLHTRSIPVAGGPVILFSVGAALLAVFLCSVAIQTQAAAIPCLLGLLLAALGICTLGVFDDFGRLRGRHKLLGQLVAVSAVIATGVRIDGIHLLNVDFDLGIMAVPFTAFFLLGAINSLNLLDGMDGLLTSFALIICLVLGCLALLANKDSTACVAFVMAATLLAFLRYNFPPATIFLGDSGSMLIGLVVGILAIDCSREQPGRMALAPPLALFSLPIFDTVAAILRRKLTGRSIYSTDRNHLHHCLLRRFGDSRLALFVICFCCLAMAASVVAGRMLDSELTILLPSLTIVVALIATGLFGHTELRMVAQHVRALFVSLLHMLPANEPRQIEIRLQGIVDWHDLWQQIIAWVPSLNLCHLRLDVNAPALGEGYYACWDRGPDADEGNEGLWRAQIPLTANGRTIGELEIGGQLEGEPIGDKIAVLAQIIHDFDGMVSLLTDNAASTAATARMSEPLILCAASLERTGVVP